MSSFKALLILLVFVSFQCAQSSSENSTDRLDKIRNEFDKLVNWFDVIANSDDPIKVLTQIAELSIPLLEQLPYVGGFINELFDLLNLKPDIKDLLAGMEQRMMDQFKQIHTDIDKLSNKLIETELWLQYSDKVINPISHFESLSKRIFNPNRAGSGELLRKDIQRQCIDNENNIRHVAENFHYYLIEQCNLGMKKISKNTLTELVSPTKNDFNTRLCLPMHIINYNDYQYEPVIRFSKIVEKNAAQIMYAAYMCSGIVYANQTDEMKEVWLDVQEIVDKTTKQVHKMFETYLVSNKLL